jgi:hypothetical protein
MPLAMCERMLSLGHKPQCCDDDETLTRPKDSRDNNAAPTKLTYKADTYGRKRLENCRVLPRGATFTQDNKFTVQKRMRVIKNKCVASPMYGCTGVLKGFTFLSSIQMMLIQTPY